MTPAKAPTPLADGTPALTIEGVEHSFGSTRALEDVAFAIHPGEFAVLLGLNGAGKTTLFSLITRLYHSRSGSIRIGGSAPYSLANSVTSNAPVGVSSSPGGPAA